MLADSVVDIATEPRARPPGRVGGRRRALDRKTLHAKAAVVKLAASEAGGRVVDRACRCSAGAATCARTRASGSTASCASTASGRARPRSSASIIGNEIAKRGLDGVLSFGAGAAVAGAAA